MTQAGSSAYQYAYDANGNAYSRQGSTITWSSYNYPVSATAGTGATTEIVSFAYGPDRQRVEQDYSGNSIYESTYYIGPSMEMVVQDGTIDYRHYIAGTTGPVAVYSRKSTGVNTFSYLLNDHQASVASITNSSGAQIVGESFDAFGSRRNPTTWSGAASNADLTTIAGITREGYTFQTALGLWMGMNHMNGRVQDAVTGRMLSADHTIADPTNSQSYNRYSYVNNNPLTYADPSGMVPCRTCKPTDGSKRWQDSEPNSFGFELGSNPIDGIPPLALSAGNFANTFLSNFENASNGGQWLDVNLHRDGDITTGADGLTEVTAPGAPPIFVPGLTPLPTISYPNSSRSRPYVAQPSPSSAPTTPTQTPTVGQGTATSALHYGKLTTPISPACALAQQTAPDKSVLDQIGTGLSGLDAGGVALSEVAINAPKDIGLAAIYLGETASRFASPVGTAVGVVKATSSFFGGSVSGGIYSSVDVGISLVLAGGGPIGVGVGFLYDAAGGTKAVVHAAAVAACMLGN